jgi:hypothetical protein
MIPNTQSLINDVLYAIQEKCSNYKESHDSSCNGCSMFETEPFTTCKLSYLPKHWDANEIIKWLLEIPEDKTCHKCHDTGFVQWNDGMGWQSYICDCPIGKRLESNPNKKEITEWYRSLREKPE